MRGYYQYYLHDMCNTFDGGLPETIYHGQTTVASAGTAVQLKAGSLPLKGGIWFKPLQNRAMYVSHSSQKPDGTNSIMCDQSNPLWLEADNLNDYWIDAFQSGDVMSWMAC